MSDRSDDGSWVLFHGITGAVDITSDDVIASLRQYGEFTGACGGILNESALPPARRAQQLSPSEEAFLKERGYLTHLSAAEEINLVPQISEVLHDEASKSPSFLVIPTLDCNYRCTYCFERPLQKNISRCSPKPDGLDIIASKACNNVTMTHQHVDAMYKMIPEIQKNHGDTREARQLILYGGEPLDADNERIVRYIVSQGIEKKYYFAAITNGHNILTFLDLFGPKGIQQVQVSIDGPKAIHDKRRIHIGGESSYDQVVKGVSALLARADTLVQMRIHVDPDNMGQFSSLLAELKQREWLNNENLIIYANTVYKKNADNVMSSEMSMDDIDARLNEIVSPFSNVMLNAPYVNIRSKILPSLLSGMQVPLQGNYCAANTGQYLFSPDGALYSCWESLAKGDSRIGTYIDEKMQPHLKLNELKIREWFGRHAGMIPECRQCSMALVCGGGCAQFAKYKNGHQNAPYCDNFEFLFRKALTRITNTFFERIEESDADIKSASLVRENYG